MAYNCRRALQHFSSVRQLGIMSQTLLGNGWEAAFRDENENEVERATEGGCGERLSQTPDPVLGYYRSPAPWKRNTVLPSRPESLRGGSGSSAWISPGGAPNSANVCHREILEQVCYYLDGKTLTGWVFQGPWDPFPLGSSIERSYSHPEEPRGTREK